MKKILVVDDKPDNLTTIKAILQNHLPECNVLTALSGKAGIEMAIVQRPDTILLDIIMPQMDGFEVCEKLKENIATQRIPIIMLTAIKTDSDSRIKGLNIGADAFLAKPIDPTELSTQVKVMLRIKAAEDKLQEENDILEELVLKRTFELKQSEEKYKALYDNAPLPYQSLNEDGSFNDVNPAWLNTLGYLREEVIGKFYKDFLHPDWKHHFEKNFVKFKQRGYVHDVSFKIRHKNGHYLDISFEGCIGCHPDGSFKQTYCVFQDITLRKQAEEALNVSVELNKSITETAFDAIISINSNGIILSWNKAAEKIFGYSSSEMISKSLNQVVPDQYKEGGVLSIRKLKGSIKGNIVGKLVEITALRKDGTEFPIELSLSSWVNKNEKFYTGIIRDISLRKKTDAELQKYRENLEELVKERTIELENKNMQLEKFNHLFVGREIRMKELKDKVKELENLIKQ